MKRQWVGAYGASLFHEQVRERWDAPEHRQFLKGWFDSFFAGNQYRTVERSKWNRWLDYGANHAPLYALTETASALVQAGAGEFKAQAVLESDLPSPLGLILCQYPFQTMDVHGVKMPINGIMWQQAEAYLQDTDEHEMGVMVVWFTTNDDAPERFRSIVPPLSLFHVGFIPFGSIPSELPIWRSWDSQSQKGDEMAEGAVAATRNLLLVLQSFWAFVQQKVVLTTPTPHPRPVRKRAEKSRSLHAGSLPVLNVIHLRATERGVSRSDTPGHVDWRFRWVVRGHWRQQLYPSLGTHRQKWIWAYIKGPDDKPLKATKDVMLVER